MLPDKMKTLLLHQAKLANPVQDGFRDHMHQYEQYASFLDACGHDTQDLDTAIYAAKAAVHELHTVYCAAAARFDENPFPFATVAVDDALRAAFEESLAKRAQQNRAKYNGVFEFGRTGS